MSLKNLVFLSIIVGLVFSLSSIYLFKTEGPCEQRWDSGLGQEEYYCVPVINQGWPFAWRVFYEESIYKDSNIMDRSEIAYFYFLVDLLFWSGIVGVVLYIFTQIKSTKKLENKQV